MTTLRAARRSDRTLDRAEALQVLAAADHGVLATVGPDGQPYAVPLNHVLTENVIYAHCALQGHKLENMAHEPRVSYCAIEDVAVDPAALSTYYASAIAFGTAELVADDGEKFQALQLLVERYCGEVSAANAAHIASLLPRTGVIRIRIDEISGKAHRKE